MSESAPKKRRLKFDTGAGRVAVLVPAEGTVADACAAAEASGRLGKRRIRTFALPDGCELVAGDRIADAVEDGEELRPVFEEAGEEGGPDEKAGGEGAGQGEAKRAASVSGSPEGGARDEGKEGNSAENDGRGDADEQESGRGMSDTDDDELLGARKAELEAEKKQKDDEERDDEDEEIEDEAEKVELCLWVRAGADEVEEIVRVRPDRVDLSAHTGLVALPAELRACAGRVRSLAVRSHWLKALPAWLGELTGLTELRVDGMGRNYSLQELPDAVGQLRTLRTLELRGCRRVKALPQGLSSLTGLEDLLLMDCSGLKGVPAWVTALTGLRVPFEEWRLRVRNKQGKEEEVLARVRPDMVDLSAHTGLVALPAELRACAGRVRALAVRSERLEALPAWLGELTRLMELRVGGWWEFAEKEMHYCPLRDLPKEVGQLTRLQQLDLSYCSGLTVLPAGLGALTRLQELDLSECSGLTALPVELGVLTRLQKLIMVECSGLTALPAGLGALTRLQKLDLSYCSGLKALPVELGALTGLQKLDLSGCSGLTALPVELGALTGLRELDMSFCPALHTPPARVVAAGTDAVLNFLRDLGGGSAPCHLVKLVLLGKQRAGKSSLADSLVRGRPATRPADDRTVGIDVRRWWLGAGQGKVKDWEGEEDQDDEEEFEEDDQGMNLPDSSSESDEFEELVAHIFDAAGHRVYRASHGAFMSADALFLLVVNSDAPEAAAAAAVLEWVEAVQQEAPGAVMGVVWTHVDLLEDPGDCDRLQRAVLARVQVEIERQMCAVDEAMRKTEGEFEADAAWREKQAQRDAELEALDLGLAAWQETGAQSADSGCIGTVADALACLAKLHHEMQEVEARMFPQDSEQHARDEAEQRLQRLREQRVKRPRILFSYGVSSKTGRGLEELREKLAALMKDQQLFPNVGMKVPLSYAMLERLAQEGRVQAEPGDDSTEAPKRAAWEDIVTSHVNAKATAGLRALCAQPYVSLRDLEREAAKVGIDKEQLNRALQFLHATGSVLHYGSDTRQHSQKLQEWVFMQPQFIIDVIKYVIRESRGEDVNDELRAMDDRIRGTNLKDDLDLLLVRGELTRSLLAELWAKFKFKAQDQRLMLELMKGFKLLRELGKPGDDERYVVPAMLPTGNLPPEFLEPRWWRPSRANAAARIEEDGAHRPAAVRVMYEVLGGQLPFGFMGELQVSLAQSEEAGDADLQQHFALERSVEEERVGGSVLCERRGNAREWVVLSHHHGSRPAHAPGAGAAGGRGEERVPALRAMAWVELMDAQKPAATEWRLFRHVRGQIRDAAQKVPGLNLREMACYVDDGGTLAKPFDLSKLRRRNQEYIAFDLDGGERKDVKRSHVLPSEDASAVMQLLSSQGAHEGQEAVDTSAQPTASQGRQAQGRLPVIEGFFCKKNPDKKQLQREIEALRSTDAMDRDEQLKTLDSMVEDSVETIDVHQEAQELNNLFTHVRPTFNPSINSQPCFRNFSDSMLSARDRNVRLLHLAGHGNRRCGFFWLKSSAVSTEYEEVPIDRMSGILKTEAAANGGTIECVVLNACETEEMGKKLRIAGVSHVVCWRSEVQDMTAKRFALDFYAGLNQQEQGQDYGRAFEQAVGRMDSGGGAARVPKKHLAAGAVDYVCLLSESGDRFPDTGHIRQGQD
jgi:GTPase SAR1 family protein